MLSAFVTGGYYLVWMVLIGLAVFGANRALGNARTALICVAGHVIGTGVSEGVVACRVAAGQLPDADRFLTDVGPSYLVVSAVVIAVICGTPPVRALAVLDAAIPVFAVRIFSGLSQLDVAAVGCPTAATSSWLRPLKMRPANTRIAPPSTARARTGGVPQITAIQTR